MLSYCTHEFILYTYYLPACMSAPAEDMLCECLHLNTFHLHCRQADAVCPLQSVNKWVGIGGGEATNVLTRQLGALLVASAASLYNLKVSLLSCPSAAWQVLHFTTSQTGPPGHSCHVPTTLKLSQVPRFC